MTREEQLRFCKICTKQTFDSQLGIVCQLTQKRAEFKFECEFFQEDPELKAQFVINSKKSAATKSIAGNDKRFFNYILDIIFMLAFGFGFGIFLSIVLSIVSPSSLYLLDNDSRFLNYLIKVVIGMIYYVTLETLTGKTFAKFITKTRVVDENGNKAGFKAICIRSLIRFIPFEAFSFLGGDGTGWHDRASRTMVIED